MQASMFSPSSIQGLAALEASLPQKVLHPQLRKPQVQPPKASSYSQRAQAAVQHDVEAVHHMLQAAKAATGTRGIGQVWPFPLDDGPASAAALTAAAAAASAAGGRGESSRPGVRSAGGRSGAGSLAAAAAAAAAAVGARRAGCGTKPSMAGRAAAGEDGQDVCQAPSTCAVVHTVHIM